MKSAEGEQSVGSGLRPAAPGSFELAAPFPSQPLVDDRQFPVTSVRLEMAGDARRFRPFSVRQLDDDRPFSVAGLEFLGPSALRPVRSRHGLPAGSGIVESACKRFVGNRFKGAGRLWSKAGAKAVLAINPASKTGAGPTSLIGGLVASQPHDQRKWTHPLPSGWLERSEIHGIVRAPDWSECTAEHEQAPRLKVYARRRN